MILPIPEPQFLAQYWQKKPLLCPRALPQFESPLSPEELAGLAMEPDIESRMVWQQKGIWRQQNGPFEENDFKGTEPWTLLVQRVDHWHDAVAALRHTLPALPRWRFDDVMVSYATDGAGVGPHFDRYDVFLLQGSGRREWRIGPTCDDDTPQLTENGLNLIPPFEAHETYLLEPGDVLYVPPGVAHWGIAQGDSMTFSLGFRAPRIADLLARRVDDVLEHLADSALLEDGLTSNIPCRPGEITPEHLANARDAMHNAIDALDDDRWLAEVVTECTDDSDAQMMTPHTPLQTTEHPTLAPDSVRLKSACKIAWMERPQGVELFIDGEFEEMSLRSLDLIITLCQGDAVSWAALEQSDSALGDFLQRTDALVASDEC